MRALALVVVLGAAACSAGDDVPSPLISNVVPDHAPAGQVVTVNGSYFCQRPANVTDDPNCNVAGAVHFGAAPGTPSSWQDTAIMVEVPAAAAGRADVQVTAAGRTSNTVTFTVD
jgi:hypothetical protein